MAELIKNVHGIRLVMEQKSNLSKQNKRMMNFESKVIEL